MNFNIRNDISNGCITLSNLKKKYNLSFKDGFMTTVVDFFTSTVYKIEINEIGYQNRIEKSVLSFVTTKKTGEDFSSPNLLTAEISVKAKKED